MFKLISLIFLPIALSAPFNEVQNKGERVDTLVIHDIVRESDSNTSSIRKRDDYQYTPGIGAHKLHTRGANFNRARQICDEEGGHLAIINSLAEERILLELFNQSVILVNVADKQQAFVGIHDLFAEGEWVTILGQSIYKTGYSKWSDAWGGQPDDTVHARNCGTLLKWGGIDDDFCNFNYAFFCEIPEE